MIMRELKPFFSVWMIGSSGPAPGALDDVDRLLGIGPRAHRPDHVVQVGHVHVLVDDDDVAAEVGARVAHRRDVAGLARVAADTAA